MPSTSQLLSPGDLWWLGFVIATVCVLADCSYQKHRASVRDRHA